MRANWMTVERRSGRRKSNRRARPGRKVLAGRGFVFGALRVISFLGRPARRTGDSPPKQVDPPEESVERDGSSRVTNGRTYVKGTREKSPLHRLD